MRYDGGMRKPWHHWIIGLIVAALLATDMLPSFAEEPAATAVPAIAASDRAEPIVVAQEQRPRKRKTLMDLLFGNEEEQRQEETPVVEEIAVGLEVTAYVSAEEDEVFLDA
jgi:coenzyme PQQ precursor peptide PqqA